THLCAARRLGHARPGPPALAGGRGTGAALPGRLWPGYARRLCRLGGLAPGRGARRLDPPGRRPVRRGDRRPAGGAAAIPGRLARRAAADPPPVRLVPSYDPYLLGYRSRALAVPDAYAKRIHPGGGLLHPALLAGGQAAGTWRLQRRA